MKQDTRRELTDEQIKASAKVLAECMDYPWEHMPEQGRKEMRKHAQAVVMAAHADLNAADRDVIRQAPEGWKLAPIEPTQAMVDGAFNAYRDWRMHSDGEPGNRDGYKRLYKAMLAASPTPPAEWSDRDGMQNEIDSLRDALKFYANKEHFGISDESSWDTVSGEPANFWCDEAGTATVEDGSVAAMALRGTPLKDDEATPQEESVFRDAVLTGEGWSRINNDGTTERITGVREPAEQQPPVPFLERESTIAAAAMIDKANAKSTEQQGEQEPIIYKRSEFTKNWTTFNVRRECANVAEARLKSPSIAELRAKVEALPNMTAYDRWCRKDAVLAEIDKMGGKV